MMTRPDYAQAASIDFTEIPVVDITDIDSKEGLARIAKELVHHAEQTGFFYLTGHGIPEAVIERAWQASKDWFDQPESIKSHIGVNQHQRGWMAQGMANLEGSQSSDAKEVFFWGWDVDENDPDVLANTPMISPNLWPVGQGENFKNPILDYYQHVLALSRQVLSAIAIGLGQPKDFFETAYKKPLGRGQLVYYPPHDSTEVGQQRFGAAPHTDFGVLTLLLQDQTGGLQAQNRKGQWIEAPPIENSFVCNIGDLLERWTNQRLHSTVHRVINSSNGNRYSIPIFCDPDSTTVIDPCDFGINREDALFEPITAGEHIAGRNSRNFSQYGADKPNK